MTKRQRDLKSEGAKSVDIKARHGRSAARRPYRQGRSAKRAARTSQHKNLALDDLRLSKIAKPLKVNIGYKVFDRRKGGES